MTDLNPCLIVAETHNFEKLARRDRRNDRGPRAGHCSDISALVDDHHHIQWHVGRGQVSLWLWCGCLVECSTNVLEGCRCGWRRRLRGRFERRRGDRVARFVSRLRSEGAWFRFPERPPLYTVCLRAHELD